MDVDRLEDLADVGPDWSISRLQTIMTCGRKYRYKYVQKVEEPVTVPLAFGSAVHKCIEKMHVDRLWSEAAVQRLWGDEWYAAQGNIDWNDTPYRKYIYDAKGPKILEAYVAKHKDDDWYALEAHFRFDPGHGLPMLRGTIDKIQRLTAGEDTPPGLIGRLAIIDYKTSKNPPDPVLLSVDPQLTIYHRAAYELLGEDVVVGLHHLPTDTIYWNMRTLRDMNGVVAMLQEGIERVEQEKFGRNISWGCKYCPYKNDCLSRAANGEE
jgi:hypothetical protein